MHTPPAPTPERPIISVEEARRHEARVAAREHANATPLPGPLLGAFLPEPVTVAGLTIEPITLSHLALLRGIDSPLITILSGAMVDFTESALIDALFVLSRPASEGRAALARGRAQFSELAMVAVGDRLPVGQMRAAAEALGRQVLAAFSTAIEHQSPEGGDANFPLPQPAAPTTASAGGSISPPSCAANLAGACAM